AGFLQIVDDLLGVFLGDALLQGLGSVVDDLLGFLQAQAGQGADNLDDGDLVGAGGLQDDVELGLLLLSGSSAGGGSSNSGGSGGDTELVLEGVNQLSQLQHGQGLDFFNHSSDLFGCHCKLPPIIVIIVV